jgi:hypothetical protein
MKDLLIVDLLCEKGHVMYNRNMLDIISATDVSFDVLSSRKYLKDIEQEDGKVVPFYSFYRSRISYSFLQFFYLVISMFRFNQYKKVLFLSYESYSLFMFLPFIRKGKVFAIVHNNYDLLSRKQYGMNLMRKISRKVGLIVLSPFLKKDLKEKEIDTIFIPHIIPSVHGISIDTIDVVGQYIFIPSYGYDIEMIKKIDDFCFQRGFTIIFKTKKEELVLKSKTIAKPYFDNYYSLLSKASFVFLPLNYDKRVSGCVYESLALNKVVILTPSKFASDMLIAFPDHIIISDLAVDPFEQMQKTKINNTSILQTNYLAIQRGLVALVK